MKNKIKKLMIVSAILCSTLFSFGKGAYAYDVPKEYLQDIDSSDLKKCVLGKLSMYKVVMTEDEIESNGNSNCSSKDTIYGQTDYQNQKILIYNSGKHWRNIHTFHHEAGHAFDSVKYMSMNPDSNQDGVLGGGLWSNSKEFLDIFEEEHNSMSYSPEMYASTKPQEYFAESFAYFVEQPYKLKESSPLTYEFIEKIYN